VGGVPDLEGRARGGWERAGRRGGALRGRGRSRGGECRARECATATGHPTGRRYRFKRARVSPSSACGDVAFEQTERAALEQRRRFREGGTSPLSPVARTGQFWINACLIAHITTPHFLYFEADCRRLHVKNRRLQVRSLPGNAGDFSWIVAISSVTRMPRQRKYPQKRRRQKRSRHFNTLAAAHPRHANAHNLRVQRHRTTPHNQLTWVSKTKSRRSATGVSNSPDPQIVVNSYVAFCNLVTRPRMTLHVACERVDFPRTRPTSFVSRSRAMLSARATAGYSPRAPHHATSAFRQTAFFPAKSVTTECRAPLPAPRRRPRAHRARPQGPPPRR
jgi:hypothetical protein